MLLKQTQIDGDALQSHYLVSPGLYTGTCISISITLAELGSGIGYRPEIPQLNTEEGPNKGRSLSLCEPSDQTQYAYIQ